VRTLAKELLTAGPIWRAGWRRGGQGCVVLTYHRIVQQGDPFPGLSEVAFRAQMEWVGRNCAPIPVDRLDEALSATWRRPPVIVTFDDGYADYHRNAYPVLKAVGIPAVNFIPTAFIDSGSHFWWDMLAVACQASRRPDVLLPWADGAVTLDETGRAAVLRTCKVRVKSTPHAERPALLGAILDALDVAEADLPIGRQVMTWDEIRSTLDLTTIGGHTHTHPLMPQISAQEATGEVSTCRDRIAAATGIRPQTFAYPSGAFTEESRNVVGRAGFRFAFSTVDAVCDPAADRLAIPRIHGASSVRELAWRLSVFRAGNSG
jgi:peptidoglycan/xylan/chitin deacetylase (PgdA/CDA1 family)